MSPGGSVWCHIMTGWSHIAQDHFQAPFVLQNNRSGMHLLSQNLPSGDFRTAFWRTAFDQSSRRKWSVKIESNSSSTAAASIIPAFSHSARSLFFACKKQLRHKQQLVRLVAVLRRQQHLDIWKSGPTHPTPAENK